MTTTQTLKITKTSTPFKTLQLLTLALLLAAFTVACGGGGGSDSPTAAGINTVDVEFKSFGLVNDARTNESLNELDTENALAMVARKYSEEMRDQGFFGHTNPNNGEGLRQRLAAAGIQYRGAAENLVQVAHPSNPAGVAHAQLMDSTAHRENILNKKYRLAGVGVARSGDKFWITQIFIKP